MVNVSLLVVVGKEPNEMKRGLKSLLVKSLQVCCFIEIYLIKAKNHSVKLCGRVTREKDVILGEGRNPVVFIKVVIGNPEEIPDWKTIRSMLENILEPCNIKTIHHKSIAIPNVLSIYRSPLFVGPTSDEARR